MGWKEFNTQDLSKLLEDKRGQAIVKCQFTRHCAGGMAADEKGVGFFVKNHLRLDESDPEYAKAVKRILTEEIGERDDTPDAGELSEKKVYQVNLIRRSSTGSFLLEHMIHACLKASASKNGFFVTKKGSKGDMAELGTVLAHGDSLKNPDRPWEVYLVDEDGKPVKTEFHEISGSVGTAKGKKSIMHHTEVAPEGTIFEFEFRWLPKQIKHKEMAAILADIGTFKIGSCRSIGYGEFKVLEAKVFVPDKDEKEIEPKKKVSANGKKKEDKKAA